MSLISRIHDTSDILQTATPSLDVFLQVISIRHRVCQKFSICFLFQKPTTEHEHPRTLHSTHKQVGGLWIIVEISIMDSTIQPTYSINNSNNLYFLMENR